MIPYLQIGLWLKPSSSNRIPVTLLDLTTPSALPIFAEKLASFLPLLQPGKVCGRGKRRRENEEGEGQGGCLLWLAPFLPPRWTPELRHQPSEAQEWVPASRRGLEGVPWTVQRRWQHSPVLAWPPEVTTKTASEGACRSSPLGKAESLQFTWYFICRYSSKYCISFNLVLFLFCLSPQIFL